MNVFEGKLLASSHRVAIVVGRFNEFIGSKLLEGAKDALIRHGASEDDITVAWVQEHLKFP